VEGIARWAHRRKEKFVQSVPSVVVIVYDAVGGESTSSLARLIETSESVFENEDGLDYAKVEKPIPQKDRDVKGGF
jgi:hypothetical protein